MRLLTTFILVVTAYCSMSFISRLIRPFSSGIMSSQVPPPAALPAGAEKATVAAGCFWGVEHMYRKAFDNKGLLDARVGYIGGDTKNPSYRSVCGGRTGREYLKNHIPESRNGYWLIEWFRCRGSPSNLRSRESHLPPAPRILLQDARPDNPQPPRPWYWNAIP